MDHPPEQAVLLETTAPLSYLSVEEFGEWKLIGKLWNEQATPTTYPYR